MPVLIAGAAVLAVLVSAQPGFARDYPWCAYYGPVGTSTYNCGFETFRQCLATISGIGGYCDHNPFYHGAPAHRRYRRH